MAHVAIEDANVLEKGLVMLIYPQEARLDQFDHSLWTAIAESCKKSLPVRWRSTHIVHPNRFFSIVHPVFMSSLPKEVQDRVVVHSGTKMKVLANLLRYCLPWDRIPSDIGGCVDLDFEKWLSERMVKEDQMQNQKPSANSSSSILAVLLQKAQAPSQAPTIPPITLPAGVGSGLNMNGLGHNAIGLLSKLILPAQPTNSRPDHALSQAINDLGNCGNTSSQQQLLNQLSQSQSATIVPESKPPGQNEGALSIDNAAASVSAGAIAVSSGQDNSEKGVAKGPKSMTKSGRKSDPRMDRAVRAKLDDAELSLVDALRVGGFVFPDISDSGTPQYSVVDSDNVKITQRKNQLLRRLRTAKKKSG